MLRHSLIAALLITSGFSFASTARAELPEGLMYSDYDAYFELNNTEEQQGNRRVDAGWYLEFEGKLFGDNIPVDSGLKYVLKQGRRVLASVECNARLRQRPNYNFDEGVPGMMEVRQCDDDDQKSKVVGDVTIEVYFIDGNDGSESLVRTHTIGVRRFERANRADQYYIVHNGEVISNVIHEYRRNERNATNAASMSNDYVGLFTWVAETESNGTEPDGDDFSRDLGVRCRVNGEALPTTFEPRVHSVRDRHMAVMASWGDGRQNERNQYYYDQYHIVMPITMTGGSELPGAARIEEHPGEWECDIRHVRTVIRTIKFTVVDGHIQPHPEETAGGVQLPARHHLAGISIPADSEAETRVDPSTAQHGPFFGVGWATDEGRALANGLPTIGEAHLPGEPRVRASRRRRR